MNVMLVIWLSCTVVALATKDAGVLILAFILTIGFGFFRLLAGL